ncbi:CMRF35-like molecule 8 isoform X2 [Epinephelus fuscoguttatus]|uniref:CMRF35-like molecule 8 isoform X2 n=1 Tax=Epinephelus fuscoguttatus TaxID=293821 RepID=UPI0020D08919|nr:CMRF35-like molecule 8 isoform X2 [Epinephelus fuscoguttatus]
MAMRKMLLLSTWLFPAVRCQQSKIILSAREGGLVNILCSYDSGYEKYPKYFSKGIYAKRRTIFKITGNMCKEKPQERKYYSCDDTKKRILNVTIYKLTLNDAGTYWCEIDAYFYDPKTEIELKVNKAPAPPKPPLVTSNPPESTTAQAITRNQRQSDTTTGYLHLTERASSTTLWPTPPAGVHTALPPLAGKELYLVVAAAAAAATAVLLLGLVVFLYFRLRKHRHDTAGDAPATVISQRVDNVYSITSPSTEPGDQHITEDVHLIYSTVRFNTEAAAQPRRQITSAAGPSEVYAAIMHPQT